MEYSWMGILSLVGVLVGMFVLLMVLVYVFERRSWTNAPRELAELERLTETTQKEFWEQVRDSFFFASMMDYTPEMIAHNLSVITTLERKGVAFEGLPELKVEFESNKDKNRGDKIEINSDLSDQVMAFIEEEIEPLEEEED